MVPNSNCSNAPSAVKICFECKSTIAPGLEHNCTRQERNMNILEMVRELSEKSRSQIVSQSLKGISYNFNKGRFKKKVENITKGQTPHP